jgi:DNA-binding NtrC family response regulator
MGQAQQKRRAVLIVEDDAELRSLTAALFEDERLETIECESAEAALATLLIGGRDVAMIFADVRLRGVMDGIDLAREVKMRWPLLPVILTSGHPRERVGELPPGVAYMRKPWRPLNVLIAAEQALPLGCDAPALTQFAPSRCRDQLPKRPVMQSPGITLSFHREMANSSRELVGLDVSAAVTFESYPRFVKGGFEDYECLGIKRSTAHSKHVPSVRSRLRGSL